MKDWTKSEHCKECDGEGFYNRVSFDTGEYREYEKEQCPECENLVASELFIKTDNCDDCGGYGFMWTRHDSQKSWDYLGNKYREQCEHCARISSKEIA